MTESTLPNPQIVSGRTCNHYYSFWLTKDQWDHIRVKADQDKSGKGSPGLVLRRLIEADRKQVKQATNATPSWGVKGGGAGTPTPKRQETVAEARARMAEAAKRASTEIPF